MKKIITLRKTREVGHMVHPNYTDWECTNHKTDNDYTHVVRIDDITGQIVAVYDLVHGCINLTNRVEVVFND